jgi:hypothetical protein
LQILCTERAQLIRKGSNLSFSSAKLILEDYQLSSSSNSAKLQFMSA